MKSETLTVRQIFQDRRQYCVPFYQRAYVWTQRNQWTALWQDIQEKAQARVSGLNITPHFLGAVVLEPQMKEGLMGVDTLHIIDGQQRLTTLQYVLASLLLALRATGIPAFEPSVIGCMQNNNEETMRDAKMERYKLWPTFRDRPHFTKTLSIERLEDFCSEYPAHFTQHGTLRKHYDHPPSLAAIWFFAHEFTKWIHSGKELASAYAESLIMAVLQDLKLVSISLEAEDDAQVIFETLNGRGAELHATDLIRNYIFMRADHDKVDAKTLYDTQWLQFEDEYWSTKQRRGRIIKPRLEWLIHATLQAEMGSEVDLSRLYNEYRRYATADTPQKTADHQLVTLTQYAEHYRELISSSGSSLIARMGRRIAAYDVTTLYPLALLISTASAPEADKSQMFSDLVSYVVRRAVCGLTPKNYNNIFLTALRHLTKVGISSGALRDYLGTLKGEASRWPDDPEFRNACMSAPLYPGRLDAAKMRSLLTELEGSLRVSVKSEEPELPNLSALDIDHILPRSWHVHWPLKDGSTAADSDDSNIEMILRSGGTLTPWQQLIHERHVSIPTLGNLTLLNLSVNRAAQHCDFAVKRDKLIANTSLRLNVPLIANTAWDEVAISTRASILADEAMKIWPKSE
ncbi:DUF262 domain-containing HNH endonuclease family protein [Pseudomonas sp. C9-3]|uniref:DUF262 domain-containing protein n=1 Tax=Pseudomonas sp. C9-3 TaxID=3078264 RepID=UPI0028E629D4|nr:DUF262 domain-containing HNH endonuclease family protein [Pseudomonas sp. C9-3]